MYECSTKCILLKTNGKCADQAGGRKRILVSTFVIRMQRRHFLLMTKILCAAGVIKLNKTIISVLVYAESTRRYNSSTFIFSIKLKVKYKKGVVVIFCDLNLMNTAKLKN